MKHLLAAVAVLALIGLVMGYAPGITDCWSNETNVSEGYTLYINASTVEFNYSLTLDKFWVEWNGYSSGAVSATNGSSWLAFDTMGIEGVGDLTCYVNDSGTESNTSVGASLIVRGSPNYGSKGVLLNFSWIIFVGACFFTGLAFWRNAYIVSFMASVWWGVLSQLFYRIQFVFGGDINPITYSYSGIEGQIGGPLFGFMSLVMVLYTLYLVFRVTEKDADKIKIRKIKPRRSH